ncbi:MAG: gluconate 2-dehydrogenase subunit 3 family protein, partial [Caldilineaceae bacterium]|nr:gluconate 2-dehydrogenase subunit 3 family protein [Caldilineaceae bacterium]
MYKKQNSRQRRLKRFNPGKFMITFNRHEKKTAEALFERMFPQTDDAPGATQIGVAEYLDRA